MKNKDKFLKSVNALLNERLPEEAAQSLEREGFKFKSPTRYSALAVALYKKAEKGDLSALKELRGLTGGEQGTDAQNTVVIIDDIKTEIE